MSDTEDNNTDPFTIDLKGDVTGELFKGSFRAKKYLSYDDHITADRIYRDILGGANPDFARPYAKDMADTISQIMVRLTKWPKWWPEYEGGLKLRDANVLKAISKHCFEVEEKALKKSEDKTDEAKDELKEVQKERQSE